MLSFHPSISVILLAGGKGLRMQTHTPNAHCANLFLDQINPKVQFPKQFLHIQGKPMVLHSFETLCAYPRTEEIIVVCEPLYYSLFNPPAGITLKWATPGERRQDSVFNALQCVSDSAQLVCIHDSARPLLLYDDLLCVIEEAEINGAATLASPVKNTIKESDEQGYAKRTLDRSCLWEIYTPQVMLPSLLKEGYAIAHAKGISVTDDTSLVELTGHSVKLVQGSSTNLKITRPEDLALAHSLLALKASL
jgi:2-C-methyl-D-erythritol 4-phosphate cytidylyltransferase